MFKEEFVAGAVKPAMKAIGAPSGDLWKVPVDKLCIVPGFNVRTRTQEYDDHIEWIANSIVENGYYMNEPLGVFIMDDGRVVVTEGHSRYEGALRAIKKGAQLEFLPCVQAPQGTSMADLTVKLVTTNSGKPLSPMEKGEVCKRLVGYGWEVERVAKRLGMTPTYVEDLLTLVGAPSTIKGMVNKGQVSATTAIAEIKKHGGKAVERLKDGLEKAVSSGKGRVTNKTLNGGAKERKAATPAGDGTARQAFLVFLEWADNGRESGSPKLEEAVKLAREALLALK